MFLFILQTLNILEIFIADIFLKSHSNILLCFKTFKEILKHYRNKAEQLYTLIISINFVEISYNLSEALEIGYHLQFEIDLIYYLV